MLRDSARRTIKARMDIVGLSRTELAAMLGISMSYMARIIAGHVREAVQIRKNIEVALGIPIWSTAADFQALTRVLRSQITTEKPNQ